MSDSHVEINLAGLQRELSDRLARELLESMLEPLKKQVAHVDETAATTREESKLAREEVAESKRTITRTLMRWFVTVLLVGVLSSGGALWKASSWVEKQTKATTAHAEQLGKLSQAVEANTAQFRKAAEVQAGRDETQDQERLQLRVELCAGIVRTNELYRLHYKARAQPVRCPFADAITAASK